MYDIVVLSTAVAPHRGRREGFHPPSQGLGGELFILSLTRVSTERRTGQMSWPSLLLEAGSFKFGKINVVMPLVKRVGKLFFCKKPSLPSSGPPSSLCPFCLASVHSASLCLRSSFCSLSSLASVASVQSLSSFYVTNCLKSCSRRQE